MEVGGWVQVSIRKKKWKIVPKSTITSTDIWCRGLISFVILRTLLKVVSHYDLNVLSMSVMGFLGKKWIGGGLVQ